MNSVYVVGGQQQKPRPLLDMNQVFDGYQKGMIVQVDTESGNAQVCVDYVSPQEASGGEEAAITFQAGTVQDDKLYICTQTEVLVYTLPDFKRVGYVSLPHFNDLHHVRPTPDGHLLVANAGLEMVMEVTLTGDVRRLWNVLGEDPWEHFSPSADYRRVSTKPHRSHPNYVFYVEDEIWATRFHQGDAICLTHPEKRIELSSERIHDGVYANGFAYFTTVNGQIVVANMRTLRVESRVDLNAMHPEGTLLGWCRGILLDEDRIWVGFSRIRPTRFRQNVTWVMRGFKHVMPTHIACYDLAHQSCMAEVDLEPIELGAIYSIFPAVPEYARLEGR